MDPSEPDLPRIEAIFKTVCDYCERHRVKKAIRRALRKCQLGTAHDEDVFHELLISLLPLFEKSGEPPVAWVMNSAKWRAIDYAERWHHHSETPVHCVPEYPAKSQEKGFLDAERHEWLVRRIADLKPRDRSILKLTLTGLGPKEISTSLRIQPGTVKSVLHRFIGKCARLEEELDGTN